MSNKYLFSISLFIPMKIRLSIHKSLCDEVVLYELEMGIYFSNGCSVDGIYKRRIKYNLLTCALM